MTLKRLLLLLLLTLTAWPVMAQTTTTGTITDPQGNPYANGTASAQKSVATGQVQPPPVNVTTNGSGTFSMSLPSPASYIFTICAAPTQIGPTGNPTPSLVCFSNVNPIAVSGGSQDVSGSLNPVAKNLGPNITGVSGVVSAGTAGQLAQYAANGNVVSGTTSVSFNYLTSFPAACPANQVAVQVGLTTGCASLTTSYLPLTGTWAFTGTMSGNYTETGNVARQGNNTHSGTELFTGGLTITTAPYSTSTTGTHSGTELFTGAMQCKNLENIRCLDAANSAGWAGATLEAKITTILADLPAGGGTIYIAAGAYATTSGAINITKANVKIECAGQGNTILTQTANADLFFVTADYFELTGCTLNDTGASVGFNMLEISTANHAKIHDNRFVSSRAAAQNTLNGVRIVGTGGPANYNETYHNSFVGIPWIAWTVSTNASGNSLTDNKIINGGQPCDINGDTANSDGNQIIGNYISGGAQSCFLQSVSGTIIKGNVFNIVGSSSVGMLDILLAAGTAQKRTIIAGNHFFGSNATNYCIRLRDNTRDTVIDGNDFDSCGTDAITATNSAGSVTWISITNNIIHNSGVQNSAGGFAAMRLVFSNPNSYGHWTIEGNTVYDDQGTPSQTYGLYLVCAGTGTFFASTVQGNDFGTEKLAGVNLSTCGATSNIVGPNREDLTTAIAVHATSGTAFHALRFTEVGTCTMAAGTCTVTWGTAFAAAPLCNATWNGTGALTGFVSAVPSTTNCVITSSVNTNTAVMQVVGTANPN